MVLALDGENPMVPSQARQTAKTLQSLTSGNGNHHLNDWKAQSAQSRRRIGFIAHRKHRLLWTQQAAVYDTVTL